MKCEPSKKLFMFCYQTLRSQANGRYHVRDNNVGAILKFDPSETNRWKYGKRSINKIQHLNAISQYLGVSLAKITSIALGET